MKRLRILAAGAAIAVAMTGGARGEGKAVLSSWLEPNHVITVHATMAWAEAVKEASNGSLDFEILLGGSLLPAATTLQGIADGVAQIGMHAATYTPADLPVSNALADMGFITPDQFVMAFAFTDFMMNSEAGYNDWRKNGVIFGGGSASPPYYFICREELATLADFEGKRMRYPGGGWARLGEHLNTVGVNIPSPEIYTALERGSVDCTASDATHLTSGATLLEVTRGITLLPTSPFFSYATWIYNVDYWQGLTEDQRRILLDQMAEAMVRMEIGYLNEEKRGLDAARERGVKISEPDQTLQNAYEQWVADGLGGWAEIVRTRHGIEDPDALLALFKTYADKWEKLLDGVDRYDEQALIALVKANLYDQIDVSSYGMD